MLPVRGSAGAAGYDLSAAGSGVIPSRDKGTVETRLAVALPAGTYARIAPRSGLAICNFIDVGVGVVDLDYRGKVKVALFNHSTEDFAIQAGDRIAQLILERIETPCAVGPIGTPGTHTSPKGRVPKIGRAHV